MPTTSCGEEMAAAKVTLHNIGGRRHSGTLQGLSGGRLTLGGEQGKTIPLSDLIAIRLTDETADERPGPTIWLANDDRLLANPLRVENGHMVAQWNRFPEWPPVRIPLETVRSVILSPPVNPAARREITRRLLNRRQQSDSILLKNGDRLDGEWKTLEPAAVTLQSAVGETRIQRRRIQAVGFNESLISFPEVTGVRAILRLKDGSRIIARNFELRDKRRRLRCQAAFGEELEIPLTAVVSLRMLGGRAVYLSDLQPAEFQFTPYLDSRWELQRDRNVLGGLLRLDGADYAKGLGMHSRSLLKYALNGQYERFSAVVGLDETAGRAGSVIVEIRLDGETVATREIISGRSGPHKIGPINVSEAETMTLLVDFGGRGDILDRVNWCNPVLIAKPTTK